MAGEILLKFSPHADIIKDPTFFIGFPSTP